MLADDAKPVHVLFLDVVGFSAFDINKQRDVICALNDHVRTAKDLRTPHFEERGFDDNLVVIPTGDGMVLVFHGHENAPGEKYLHEPVFWAREIVKCLLTWNAREEQRAFCLRMGMHSQHVHSVRDVNGKLNFAGPGINLAQRVMDCGDAWHILASGSYAQNGLAFPDVTKYFSRIAKRYEIKGSQEFSIHNVHGIYDEIYEAPTENWPDRRTLPGLGSNPLDWPNPDHKPRLDGYPKELRRGIMLTNRLLEQGADARGQAALVAASSWSQLRRLEAIQHARKIRCDERLWDHVWSLLEKFISESTTMELVSLIRPTHWSIPEWRDYQTYIFHIATSGRAGSARRLHVLHRSDVFDGESCSTLRDLVNLMTAEFVCSVRARALVVDSQQELVNAAGDAYGYAWKDFFLCDAATFAAPGGNHQIIFSDIQPYWISKDSAMPDAFCLYDFGHDRHYIHSELAANFFRGWHARHIGPKSVGPVLRLTDVYRCAKKRLQQLNNESMPVIEKEKILTYLPESVGRDFIRSNEAGWERRVEAIIEHFSYRDAAVAERGLLTSLSELRGTL